NRVLTRELEKGWGWGRVRTASPFRPFDLPVGRDRNVPSRVDSGRFGTSPVLGRRRERGFNSEETVRSATRGGWHGRRSGAVAGRDGAGQRADDQHQPGPLHEH